MTTPDKSGPIAPRRPLAKQAGGPPRSGDGRPAAQATATKPEVTSEGPEAGAASSEQSSNGDVPRTTGANGASRPLSSSTRAPSKSGPSRSAPSAASPGAPTPAPTPAPAPASATASPGGSGTTSPMAPQVAAPRSAPTDSRQVEPSYPMYESRGAVDLETQA